MIWETKIELKLVIVENGEEHPFPAFNCQVNNYLAAEVIMEKLRQRLGEIISELSPDSVTEIWSPIATTGARREDEDAAPC